MSHLPRFPWLVLAAMALAATATADPVDWSAFNKSFEISFPRYTGTETLTDFPVLIRLSAARNAFLYDKCPNGASLRFSDAEGNLLSSEVDTWDPNGESLVWVKVPSLNTNTVITAYYGCANPPEVNPKSVWSNGYVGVWHLGEDGLSFPDSTTNGLDFSCSQNHVNYVGRGVENGAVGKSVEFGVDGSTKGALSAEDSDLLDGFQTVTFEFWTYQTNHVPGRTMALLRKQGTENTAFRFYQNNDDPRTIVGFYVDGYSSATWWANAGKGSGAIPLSQWNHQAYTYNWKYSDTQSRSYGYLNGTQIASRSESGNFTFRSNSGNLCLGNDSASSTSAYVGRMDEFRISNVARSAAWVKATYETVHNDEFALYRVSNDWKRYSHTFSVSFPGATNGVLSAFPVLVKVSTNDIPNFRYADCLKPNGGDLRFADENGNLLDSEIDVWNPEGVSLVWVNVPTLTSNAAIKAYYGWSFAPAVNALNVWTNGFVGVWHLGESENPLHVSVSGASDFTTFPGSAKAPDTTSGILWAQAGAVGKAVNFKRWGDYTNSCVRAAYRDAYNGMSALTVEAWTYRDSTVLKGGYVLDMAQRPGTDQAYCMYDKTNSRVVEFDFWNTAGTKTTLKTGGNVSADTWVYQAATFDSESEAANNAILYINASASASAAGGNIPVMTTSSSGNLHLGNAHNYTGYNIPFPGLIDEVRISNVARSAGWLRTTYDMIQGNACFSTYSSAKENTEGTVLIFR